ncbi:hypothetical protein HZH68_010256 [Vespula germanica]|uniref:Uncharacterized protein n=1 Tax=Vespula germanica TaxID=30212 RepID=A0A834N1Z7_VESGE|nr:hypothetical protein HZH68_010256 [Vespula germanica]
MAANWLPVRSQSTPGKNFFATVNELQHGFSCDPLKYLVEVVLGCGGAQPPGIGVVRDARWGLLAEERLIQGIVLNHSALRWDYPRASPWTSWAKVEEEQCRRQGLRDPIRKKCIKIKRVKEVEKVEKEKEKEDEDEDEDEDEEEEEEGAHRLRASIARLSDSR